MSQQKSKLLKTYIYPAFFIEEKEGGYSVIFPDLLGCQTQGNSLAESLLMAKGVPSGKCEFTTLSIVSYSTY